MTGFILYQNGGFPVIHADLMISAKVGENREDDFPTLPGLFGKQPPLIRPEYIPVSLMQKIVVVDPQTAYLWAGPQSDAKRLHRIIERHRNNGKIEASRCFGDLVSESPKSESLFSAVILSAIDNISTNIGLFNSGPIEFPVLGSVITGGLGQGEFFAVAAELVANIPEHLALESYDRGEIEKQTSDQIVRADLIDSLLQLRTLHDAFGAVHTGGGIETATISGEGIRKIENTVYLIFIEDTFDEIGFSPRFVLKRYYSDNYLGISLYDYFSGGGRHATIPHPGNSDTYFRFSEEQQDPWTGPVQRVFCIFQWKSGIASHFSESPEYFRQHFKFDSENRNVVVSDWYRADVESKMA